MVRGDFVGGQVTSSCPRTGSGVHLWLLAEANRCRLRGLSASAAADVLKDASRNCGRPVPSSEIAPTIRKAYSTTTFTPRSSLSYSVPKWPPLNTRLRAEIIAQGGGLADLWEASPIRVNDQGPGGDEIVSAMFPADCLLSVIPNLPLAADDLEPDAASWKPEAITMPKAKLMGKFGWYPLMVPSPMSALTGTNAAGETSTRCLNNTGPRRFQVVEFDSGTLHEQAALLLHLAGFAPMVAACWSGGKSLHGWFLVEGQPELAGRFFRYSVSLGADPALDIPCQPARIPGGRRRDHRKQPVRQTVLFFNPSVLP